MCRLCQSSSPTSFRRGCLTSMPIVRGYVGLSGLRRSLQTVLIRWMGAFSTGGSTVSREAWRIRMTTRPAKPMETVKKARSRLWTTRCSPKRAR